MSEYQYYEFRAIDRPLSRDDIAELRRCSTRAEITPTSFVNVYNWGSFKGDTLKWMEKYFDAFLYTANWGTRTLMFRVPAKLFNTEKLNIYCGYDGLTYYEKGDSLIFEFESVQESGEWIDGEGRLSALLPIRDELMQGDYRALYIGFLLALQNGGIDDFEGEPPVPPGLGVLSDALSGLVEFFDIDPDLVAVAAENSQDGKTYELSEKEVAAWLAELSLGEKDALLAAMVKGDNPHLSAELRVRITDKRPEEWPRRVPLRTAGELVERAEKVTEERERKAAEKRALEQAQREKERAEQRKRRLESLAGKEDNLWIEIEGLIRTRQPKKYEVAVALLEDLRDLGVMNGDTSGFETGLRDLLGRHAQKQSLIRKIMAGGLEPGHDDKPMELEFV